MRTIKFRVWEKDEEYLSMPFTFSDIEPNGEIEVGTISLEECVVMQFTGLLDKNGKEIYEGDIMRYEHDCDSFGKCEHGEWDDKEVRCDGQCFYTSFVFTKDENYQGVLYTDGEVIGNIYENPDLLKPKRNLKQISTTAKRRIMIEKLPKPIIGHYPNGTNPMAGLELNKNTPETSQMMWDKINEIIEALNQPK